MAPPTPTHLHEENMWTRPDRNSHSRALQISPPNEWLRLAYHIGHVFPSTDQLEYCKPQNIFVFFDPRVRGRQVISSTYSCIKLSCHRCNWLFNCPCDSGQSLPGQCLSYIFLLFSVQLRDLRVRKNWGLGWEI